MRGRREWPKSSNRVLSGISLMRQTYLLERKYSGGNIQDTHQIVHVVSRPLLQRSLRFCWVSLIARNFQAN